jgi:hypothetical protein
MKNPVVITMLVIALVLIGGIVAVFLVFNVFDREAAAPTPVPTPTPAPAPTSTPPPAPAPPSGPSLEDKLKDLEQVIIEVRTSDQPQEVTIVLTEAEVNAQASQSLTQQQQSGDFKVLSVRIDLKPNNNMVSELQAQALGFTIPIKVNMTVGVKDGKPAVTISDISFGMLPVPQTMKDQIAAAIANNIDDLVMQMTQQGVGGGGVIFEFKSITIRESDMTIVALVKPA